MVGRVGNGRAKTYDLIEDMDSVGVEGGWEWEGKCIQIRQYNCGQIYDGEGMVGRVGNGRAKIY